MIRGLISGVVGSGSGGWNTENPTYSLDFMHSALPTGCVFSRASTKTDNVNSWLVDFDVDAPAVSPFNGYLGEGQRTNSLTNSEATGFAIGAPGTLPTAWSEINTIGLTREVKNAGTGNGFKFIDLKLSGTPSAGTYTLLFESTSVISATSGEAWAGSAYVGLQSGALTGVSSVSLRVSERNAGTETAGASVSFTPAINPTRRKLTRVLTDGATTAVVLQLDIVFTGVASDLTLRIASPQLENGYGVTSYIRTTIGAVTRAADVCYLPASALSGMSAVTGAVTFAGISPNDYRYSKSPFALYAGDGTQEKLRLLQQSDGDHEIISITGGAVVADAVADNLTTADVLVKYAVRWGEADILMARDGSIKAIDTESSSPPEFDSLAIGSGWSTTAIDHWNGYITGIEIYRGFVTNPTLKGAIA